MKPAFNRCSLYLCPVQADFSITACFSLVTVLQQVGFIAGEIADETTSRNKRYLTGEKFLELISYMGCAPAIQLAADKNNDNFCYIKIIHLDQAQLIYSPVQNKPPLCPECKKPVKDWRPAATATQFFCPLCNTTSSIKNVNWRKMAGYARLFVEITDVFPKEAIPQPLLLDKLATITNTGWQYFHSCR